MAVRDGYLQADQNVVPSIVPSRDAFLQSDELIRGTVFVSSAGSIPFSAAAVSLSKRLTTFISLLTGGPKVTIYARGTIIRQFIPPQPPPYDWMVPARTTNYIWPYPVLDEKGRPR